MIKKIIKIIVLLGLIISSSNFTSIAQNQETFTVTNNTDVIIVPVDCSATQIIEYIPIVPGASNNFIKVTNGIYDKFEKNIIHLIPLNEDVALTYPSCGNTNTPINTPILESIVTENAEDIEINGSFKNNIYDINYSTDIGFTFFSELDDSESILEVLTSLDDEIYDICINDTIYSIERDIYLSLPGNQDISIFPKNKNQSCEESEFDKETFFLESGKYNTYQYEVDSFFYALGTVSDSNDVFSSVTYSSGGTYPTPSLCINDQLVLESSSGSGLFPNVNIGDEIYLPFPGDDFCDYNNQQTILITEFNLNSELSVYSPEFVPGNSNYNTSDNNRSGFDFSFQNGVIIRPNYRPQFGLADSNYDVSSFRNSGICLNGEFNQFKYNELEGYYVEIDPGVYELGFSQGQDCTNPLGLVRDFVITKNVIETISLFAEYNSDQVLSETKTDSSPQILVRSGSNEQQTSMQIQIIVLSLILILPISLLLIKED